MDPEIEKNIAAVETGRAIFRYSREGSFTENINDKTVGSTIYTLTIKLKIIYFSTRNCLFFAKQKYNF